MCESNPAHHLTHSPPHNCDCFKSPFPQCRLIPGTEDASALPALLVSLGMVDVHAGSAPSASAEALTQSSSASASDASASGRKKASGAASNPSGGGDYLPALLNGCIIGVVAASEAPRLVRAVRELKVRRQEGVPQHLEIAYVPYEYTTIAGAGERQYFRRIDGGPFPAIYFSTDAARMVRPIVHLGVLTALRAEVAAQRGCAVDDAVSVHLQTTAAIFWCESFSPFVTCSLYFSEHLHLSPPRSRYVRRLNRRSSRTRRSWSALLSG